jgi:hypothetical protein
MKTAVVADCLQQDVRILNDPKRMIFQNGATTPKRLRTIPLRYGWRASRGGWILIMSPCILEGIYRWDKN